MTSTDPTTRRTGFVAYHNVDKGYGKILADEGEHFFHITGCGGSFATLTPDTPVSFLWRMTEKGLRAFDVQQIAHASAAVQDAVDTRGNR